MLLISLQSLKIYVLNIMTKKNIINNAPKPVGNYPHSVEVNGMLYLSGIGPRNPRDNSIPGNEYDANGDLVNYDIKQQTHAVFDNIKIILKESNSSLKNLIDITVFLTDIDRDFEIYNKIYADYFKSNQPCRTTVQVSSLPTPIAIELKCIATID